MILKEKEYKGSNIGCDWEEVPQEDLWEDGEIGAIELSQKIFQRTINIGEWKLIRRIDGNN